MKFHIFEEQLASYQETEDEKKSLRDDLEEWRAAQVNLEAETKILIDEMKETINSMANEITNLKSTNNELEEYIKLLGKKGRFVYKGKDISETKNKQRTLKAFLTRAETAMWFGKAFDLELESLKVKEAKTGKNHEVNAETKTDDQGNTQLPRMK